MRSRPQFQTQWSPVTARLPLPTLCFITDAGFRLGAAQVPHLKSDGLLA